MFCTVVSQVNSCQLLNNISMVGCVLTHAPHKCDITTSFIEEVEKVERKQCGNIHSWCFVPASQKCCVSVTQSLCYITDTKTLACLFWPVVMCLHVLNIGSHTYTNGLTCVTYVCDLEHDDSVCTYCTPIHSSVALCSSRWDQPWCALRIPRWFEGWATTNITRGRAKCAVTCSASLPSKKTSAR